MNEQIAEVRWHSAETEDVSDYGGMITPERANPRTLWQRLVRLCCSMLGRHSTDKTIPAHAYEASTDRTACFFDLVLRNPLPLGRVAAYWGFVDSAVSEHGICLGDGWPLPRELNATLRRLIGYHFRVINPTTILLSCWKDGQPDLDCVLEHTGTLLGCMASRIGIRTAPAAG